MRFLKDNENKKYIKKFKQFKKDNKELDRFKLKFFEQTAIPKSIYNGRD